MVAAGFLDSPRITVWDGLALAAASLDGTPLANVFAFEESLRNGAVMAVDDVNGDGKVDIIFGGAPRIRVADGVRILSAGDYGSLNSLPLVHLANFFAGNPTSHVGVRMAVMKFNNDNWVDLLTGEAPGTSSRATACAGSSLGTDRPLSLFDIDLLNGFAEAVYVG